MNETEKYPDQWQGEIPEEIKSVVGGQASMTINIYSCLEYLQHLAYPVYKPLEGLKVWDPACGTGESLLAMAAKYPQLSFTAGDSSAEALAQAGQYAEELELKNVVFLSGPPEQADFDFILPTRPLQHIDDLPGFLENIQAKLADEGLLLIHSYTGSQPEENLYLQDRVADLKAGSLNEEEARELIRELLEWPLKDHIDGLRECNQMMERAGFKFLYGLHPRTYEPARYLLNADIELFAGLSPVDRAYLAEQLSRRILRHSLLYSQSGYQFEMLSFYDPKAAKYIPHLSPYAGSGQVDGRQTAGLRRQFLMLEKEMEVQDLSLPPELFRVLPAIDGKKNCEQLHRRFLPLPWEHFWELIQACWEEEIIYLHRPRGFRTT